MFGLVLCIRGGSFLYLVLFAGSAGVQIRRFAVWRREWVIPIPALPALPPDVRIESPGMTTVRVVWTASFFAACAVAGVFLTLIAAAAEGWAFGAAVGAGIGAVRRLLVERKLRCRVFTDVAWTTPVIGARETAPPQFYKVDVGGPTSSVAQNV